MVYFIWHRFLKYNPKKNYFFTQIMTKFKKLLILKVITLITVITFSVTSASYGIDLCNKTYLRVPIAKDTYERIEGFTKSYNEQERNSPDQVEQLSAIAELEKLPSRDVRAVKKALLDDCVWYLKIVLHDLGINNDNMMLAEFSFREFFANKIMSIDLVDARSTQVLYKTMRDTIDSLWQEIKEHVAKKNRDPQTINTYIEKHVSLLYNEISQRILSKIVSFDTERPDKWRSIEVYISRKIADANRKGINIRGIVVYGSWPKDIAHDLSDVDCITILPEQISEDLLKSFMLSLNDGAPYKIQAPFSVFIDKPRPLYLRKIIAGYSTRPAWSIIAVDDRTKAEIQAKMVASWRSLLDDDAMRSSKAEENTVQMELRLILRETVNSLSTVRVCQ